MYQKSLNKSRGQFLRLVLMQNIKQIDPHDKQSILFYQDRPQLQLLLDLCTSLHSELFALSSSLESFEAIQNFISKIKAQYDYWHYHQQQPTEICPEQMFLTNLSDLLHWIKNTKKGGLRRHLQFQQQDLPEVKQFFIFGHNLIQVCRLNRKDGARNRFVVHIRNASFNSETYFQINNP